MPLEHRKSEDVPFLSDSHQPVTPTRADPEYDHDSESSDEFDKPVQQPNAIDSNVRLRLMVTLFTMVLAVEVGLVMAGGPVTRIYESIVCREYYAQHDPTRIASNGQVEEELCKVKDVQSELAAVKGYMEFFDGILSMSNMQLPCASWSVLRAPVSFASIARLSGSIAVFMDWCLPWIRCFSGHSVRLTGGSARP